MEAEEAKAPKPRRGSREPTLQEILAGFVRKQRWSADPPEHPQDRAARLANEKADSDLRRRKEFILFLSSLIVPALTLVLCAIILLNPHSPENLRDWAKDIYKYAFGAFIGLLIGGKTIK